MANTALNPKLAIIGAGPASLTLASILKKNSIPFIIFEASDTLRHSGGSLDLHPQTGQAALKEAGLWEQFVQVARPESDLMKIVDVPTGEILWDENGPDKQDKGQTEEEKMAGRPEVDRADLIKITYKNLDEESVKWGKKLKEVVPNGEQYDLQFSDGTTENGFDLVVGGDGAWSKVRKLLSDAEPQYSGISMAEVWHNDVKSNEWLVNYVGEGSCFAFGKDTAVISQRQGDGSLRTYACLRIEENFIDTCGIDWSDEEKARKDYMDRYFSHVAKDLQRVFLESKDHLVARTLYELPIGFEWKHRSGVTLIGDAAHLMSPFAGVGVNVGMADSLMLAREIIAASKGEKTVDEALQAYEKDMFPRALKAATKTDMGKERHFKEDGSKVLADMLKGHYYGGVPAPEQH